MALGICLYWEAGMLEPAGGMTARWGERWMGGCIMSLFLTLVSQQKTLSFVLLTIQDYIEQCKQIKNGHHNILLISFKKLIRLQRHSTERVHGPLPWMDAENPHVNQLVIAESVWEAGTGLKQMTNIPALDLCTMHALSIYSLPTCLILSAAILKHQCKIMPSGENHPIFMFLWILPSLLLFESLQKKRMPQRGVEFYVNKIFLVISGIAISEYFFFCNFKNSWYVCVCLQKSRIFKWST